MLQRIRDNASGPMAYAVVGLISLVFGVWGIGSYFTPSANPEVATVGDTKITRYQLQQAYNQRYQRFRQEMGDRFDADTFQPQQFRRAVLQQLIQAAVMDQYALETGYRTTDQALLQALTANPSFQVDGKFSTERYKAILANSGMTPAAYEQQLRRSIVTQQVGMGIAAGTFVAPPAVEHTYSLLKQQRDIAYALFSANDYVAQVRVDDADVQAWYDTHKDSYMRPERVKLAYVELERSTLQPQQTPTQKELRELYQQNQKRFSTPDTRDGKQIFVPVTADDNAAQARQLIQVLAKQLEQGQSFADAAANADGEVEYKQLSAVARTQLGDDMAAALFGTKIGDVSAPVRTSEGWYLFKPTAETAGETQPFESEEVQAQLKQLALAQWRNQQFGDLAERMETLAFQAPNSLDTLAEELDLKIRESGWITRTSGEGLGQSEVVRKAAFSNAVLDKNLNSTALQLGQNRRVVVRVAEHQTPQQLPLDEVRQQVREQLQAARASQLATEAAQTARQELREGGDAATLQAVAKANAGQYKAPGYIGRTAEDVPLEVREAAFAMVATDDSAVQFDVASLTNGDAVLIALRGVKTEAMPEEGGASDMITRRRRNYLAQLEYAAYATYISQHAEVELNDKNLDVGP